MTATLTGRCLCGAVRFEALGLPKWTGYCHCESCRRHTGAPVAAYAGFEREAVRWPSGEPAKHVSSPGVLRGFCAACGSTLTYEGERWPTEVNAEERVPWLHLGAPGAGD